MVESDPTSGLKVILNSEISSSANFAFHHLPSVSQHKHHFLMIFLIIAQYKYGNALMHLPTC